ncbi:MAG: folate family ECF transporter S component [Clostridiales bacterium]|jgi:ECF transporter S component (folate family)|nr:folate family ECF transporter S component [Clostridiales bacterium]
MNEKKNLAQQEIAPLTPSSTTPPIRGLSSQKITYTALFIALSIAFNTFSKNTTVNSLSLTYVLNFFAGVFLGPLHGFLAGFFGDMFGFMINSQGMAYLPLIGIASGLTGFFPGLVMNNRALERLYARLKKSQLKIWFKLAQITFSMLLIALICTLLINTYAIYSTVGAVSSKYSFAAYVALRAASQLPIVAANTVIIAATYLSFERQLLRIKFKIKQ